MADMVKIAVIFLLNIQNAFCQGFAADSDIVTGGTVKLVCDVTIAAFTAPVILFKDNVQKTSCDNGNICTSYSSDSGRYQYSSNVSAVTVQISNLTKANDEGTWVCRVGTSHSYTHNLVFPSTENPDNEGPTTESTAINLSTDVGTTTLSGTSSKMSTESLSHTQTSIVLSESTIEDNTLSETSTALVVTSSPSGLPEEMIIIISTVSAFGGILLIGIIVFVVFCCKRRNFATKSEKYRNKHSKQQIKNGNHKDLNSNYEQSQKIKHNAHLGRKIQGGTDFVQKHPQKNILYGGRMSTGVEFPRSQTYHQQNLSSRNQHHNRNQNIAYYLPHTNPRDVMYHQRYPGSEYSEDMLGYSRAGPYRMQHFYPQSYRRQDRYPEDGLERRIGHRRGEYEGNWNVDTLY